MHVDAVRFNGSSVLHSCSRIYAPVITTHQPCAMSTVSGVTISNEPVYPNRPHKKTWLCSCLPQVPISSRHLNMGSSSNAAGRLSGNFKYFDYTIFAMISMTNRWLLLYVLSMHLAPLALLLPQVYSTAISLAFFLYPVFCELHSLIGAAVLANIKSSNAMTQSDRARHTLNAIVSTAACLGCLSSYRFLGNLQFTNILVVLACPLWHTQLSIRHREALAPVEEERDALAKDKVNLSADLAAVQASLETTKQDLSSSNNRLQRSATECIRLRKIRDAFSVQLEKLEAQLPVALKKLKEMELKNAALADELEYLHKRLDNKDEECEDLHAKMRKARAKQLTAERHLNLFSLDLECVSFKLNKFREFMGDPFGADYGDILFDEGANLRSGVSGESFGSSEGKSSYTVFDDVFTSADGGKRNDDSGIYVVRDPVGPPRSFAASTPKKRSKHRRA
ncbi:hypothetical protein SCHPADRAFT_85384 [Schizopora paradoxa]|uniref:Uncharacterized protein n=1 Tax=Schizopora paradoxa TaxID=27342 RepID=A0A0H2S513_9AGAM|nr:hypothetical protein SCHPADRAFT_85384 [Schizopora paradoxa]